MPRPFLQRPGQPFGSRSVLTQSFCGFVIRIRTAAKGRLTTPAPGCGRLPRERTVAFTGTRCDRPRHVSHRELTAKRPLWVEPVDCNFEHSLGSERSSTRACNSTRVAGRIDNDATRHWADCRVSFG